MNHARGASKVPLSLRILIADNDRGGASTLTMVLRQDGHEVLSVYTGPQALAAVRDFDPHVALLDIALAELSGSQVARKINGRIHKRPLMIAVSEGYRVGPHEVLSEITGFDHYLVKPYLIAEVLKLIAPLRV